MLHGDGAGSAGTAHGDGAGDGAGTAMAHGASAVTWHVAASTFDVCLKSLMTTPSAAKFSTRWVWMSLTLTM